MIFKLGLLSWWDFALKCFIVLAAENLSRAGGFCLQMLFQWQRINREQRSSKENGETQVEINTFLCAITGK